MSNTKNYGWAYVHPTASQAQARGVDKSIQFLTGAVDSNGIGLGSGSAKLTFDSRTFNGEKKVKIESSSCSNCLNHSSYT